MGQADPLCSGSALLILSFIPVTIYTFSHLHLFAFKMRKGDPLFLPFGKLPSLREWAF